MHITEPTGVRVDPTLVQAYVDRDASLARDLVAAVDRYAAELDRRASRTRAMAEVLLARLSLSSVALSAATIRRQHRNRLEK